MNMDKKIAKTFYEWRLNTEWAEITERYVLHGLSPGSFFTSLFANDLIGAAARSHPSNSWEEICKLSDWLTNRAPRQCFGSYENVESWLELNTDDRRKICESINLQMSAWDHLSDKEPAKSVDFASFW